MPADVNSQLEGLPGGSQLVHQADGWWMDAPNLDVLAAARCMQEWGGRLSTITATMLPADETELIYHYYLEHQLFNFKVVTQHNLLPSISPILPAADWIEREIQDLYQVEFKAHPHPYRLIRPVQLKAGFFREPGGSAAKK